MQTKEITDKVNAMPGVKRSRPVPLLVSMLGSAAVTLKTHIAAYGELRRVQAKLEAGASDVEMPAFRWQSSGASGRDSVSVTTDMGCLRAAEQQAVVLAGIAVHQSAVVGVADEMSELLAELRSQFLVSPLVVRPVESEPVYASDSPVTGSAPSDPELEPDPG